jgi:nucleoside-diphosphate-sugar epimerase
LVARLADLQGCPAPQRILPLPVARFLCWLGDWMGRLKLRRHRPPVISPAALRFLGTSRWVDIARAREELGYQPRVTIREGLADTLRWLEEQSHEPADLAHSTA